MIEIFGESNNVLKMMHDTDIVRMED